MGFGAHCPGFAPWAPREQKGSGATHRLITHPDVLANTLDPTTRRFSAEFVRQHTFDDLLVHPSSVYIISRSDADLALSRGAE